MREKMETRVFDIVIFEWDYWNEVDTGIHQCYGIEFPYESMKKFNGMNATLDLNGRMTVFGENVDKQWEGFVAEILEFYAEMCKKFKKKKVRAAEKNKVGEKPDVEITK